MQMWYDKARQGPYAFMVVRADGINPGMAFPMAIGFLLNALVAGLLMAMLGYTNLKNLKSQTLFIGMGGTVGSLIPNISHWIWWHFPASYTIVNVVDTFLTWTLAGLVMAKLSAVLEKKI